MEADLSDPSASPWPPKWLSLFSNRVLRDTGCELLERATAVLVGISSSLSCIEEDELHQTIFISEKDEVEGKVFTNI